MTRYTQLYAWIRHAFRDEAFTIDQFRAAFPSSQAAKVIHDLISHGYIRRVKRGHYQAVPPEQFIRNVVAQDENTRDIAVKADRKYAYTDSTAVAIWTQGYYWTGFTRGFRPIHIKVLDQDVAYWEQFFRKHRMRYAFPDDSKTLFGFVHILHPQPEFSVTEQDGRPVIPLEEVVRFCKEREMAYQPALEYLDEIYGIGYRERVSMET